MNPLAELSRRKSTLMILGKEFYVRSGAIDFIACDVDANIYLIETKLAENPELRRTVIGQVMEYASNLSDLPFSSFKIKCESFLGKSLDNFIKNKLQEIVNEPDAEYNSTEYINQLEKNLANGQLCIVVITNKINFEIQKLFSYLDEKTRDDLNFVVLEVNKYAIAGNTFVYSNVVWAAKFIRSLFSRKVIREDQYISSKTPHIQQILGSIDTWCTNNGLNKTQTTKGISWKAETGGSIFVSNDWLDTNWSTIQADSNDFRQFKAAQINLARDAGFTLHTGKHGGFRLALTNTISEEYVTLFLKLAFAVIDRGRQDNNQN